MLFDWRWIACRRCSCSCSRRFATWRPRSLNSLCGRWNCRSPSRRRLGTSTRMGLISCKGWCCWSFCSRSNRSSSGRSSRSCWCMGMISASISLCCWYWRSLCSFCRIRGSRQSTDSSPHSCMRSTFLLIHHSHTRRHCNWSCIFHPTSSCFPYRDKYQFLSSEAECWRIWYSRVCRLPSQWRFPWKSTQFHTDTPVHWQHSPYSSQSFCNPRYTSHQPPNNSRSIHMSFLKHKSTQGIHTTWRSSSIEIPFYTRISTLRSSVLSSRGFTCSWTRIFFVLSPKCSCPCNSKILYWGWSSRSLWWSCSWSCTFGGLCWRCILPHRRIRCSFSHLWRFLSAGKITAGNCS